MLVLSPTFLLHGLQRKLDYLAACMRNVFVLGVDLLDIAGGKTELVYLTIKLFFLRCACFLSYYRTMVRLIDFQFPPEDSTVSECINPLQSITLKGIQAEHLSCPPVDGFLNKKLYW